MAGALARTSDGVTVVSGTAERGTGLPMAGADARFRVGSLSKPVIAVTVMRLVERGEIKLGSVPAKTLRAMTADAVRVGEPGWPAKARYGLGVAQARLSCGEVWMHGGDVPGVSVLSGRTRAGRAATVYVTGSAATEKHRERLLDAFDTAMCG
jgi:hypothetical protein